MVGEQQGGRGGGPKKPQATFGDVLLGIPAGRGGRQGRGGSEGGRKGERPGADRSHDRPKGRERAAQAEGAAPKPGPQAAAVPEGRSEVGKGSGREGKRGRRGQGKGPAGQEKRAAGKGEERKVEVVVVRRVLPEAAKREAEPAEGAPVAELPVAELLAAAAPEQSRGRSPAPFRRSELPPPAAEQVAQAEPAGPEESFAELLAKAPVVDASGEYRAGQKVKGLVIQIGQGNAFLALGGKTEASIDLVELKDAEGNLKCKIGDVVEGYVVSGGERGLVVTTEIKKGAGALAALLEARQTGAPVEGLVAAVNKGGWEVDFAGVRGFCPRPHMDLRFVEDPASFVGQRLQFRVMELTGRDLLVSRKALLQAEAEKLAEQTRQKLAVGAVFKGKVSSVRDFGAFVDIGGLEGLVHVSELSYARVAHPREVVTAGQEVEVEVLRIDAPEKGDKAGHGRIGLSMKSRQQDPWSSAAATLAEGQRLNGKVVRLQPFGAFVELMPGVDGLVHVSQLSDRRIQHPREVVSEGQVVLVEIESIDREQRRIGLRLAREGEAAVPAAAPGARQGPRVGDVVEATVDKVEPFGVFVRFASGRGLIPNAEMGTPKGSDHRKAFPPGMALKAVVLEIDERGRVRLSRSALEKAEERSVVDEYARSQKPSKGAGFGTLGDLLKLKKQGA